MATRARLLISKRKESVMLKVTESFFNDTLKTKLGGDYDRALTLFRNCGPNLGWDVTNVLMHAAEKGKVNEVLGMLEEHYENHLKFQHPDARGMIGKAAAGGNPTEALFLQICDETLGLKPAA
jgi:hypothetical protein